MCSSPMLLDLALGCSVALCDMGRSVVELNSFTVTEVFNSIVRVFSGTVESNVGESKLALELKFTVILVLTKERERFIVLL